MKKYQKNKTKPCLDEHEGSCGLIIHHDLLIGDGESLSAYKQFAGTVGTLAWANCQLFIGVAQAGTSERLVRANDSHSVRSVLEASACGGCLGTMSEPNRLLSLEVARRPCLSQLRVQNGYLAVA